MLPAALVDAPLGQVDNELHASPQDLGTVRLDYSPREETPLELAGVQ